MSKINYYGYNIERKSYTYVTRQADPNSEWDADDTNTDWNISNTIKASEDNYNCDVVLPFLLEEDKVYYAVYVMYGDGDSYSSDTRCHLDFITVFKDRQKAQDLVKKIKEGPEDYSFSYQDEVGKTHHRTANWMGYFNGIDECQVHEVRPPALTLNSKIKRMI